MSDKMQKVMGFCPMGCGATLFLGEGGHVTCSFVECPAPDAVDRLLADRDTEHIVRFDEQGFSMQHPLRERLDGALLDCTLHARLRAEPEMPVPEPGVYRVVEVDGALAATLSDLG